MSAAGDAKGGAEEEVAPAGPAPLLQGLIAPAGATVARTVQQAPPKRSSLVSVAAETNPMQVASGWGTAASDNGGVSPRAGAKKPFQTYKIEDMKTVLNDPANVCARTQMELRGMERSPKQLQLRVSESLQAGLKAYCEDTNVQQRALVEALLRAFLAEIGRPVQD